MYLFLVSVGLLASACADPIQLNAQPRFLSGRIIGGEDASIETYPYQISLEAYGRHNCGGSIISAHYVLTAGHCVDVSPKYLTVRAGTAVIGKGGSLHQVSKIIRHEKYHVNRFFVLEFDIAILRVEKPFTFGNTCQPIALYEKSDIIKAGEMSVITGWGETGSGLSSQLQTISIPIIDSGLCHKAYLDTHGALPQGQICAAYYGVGGKDTCRGDSGGPLAINGRLAGVVSWGNGCAQAYYPGVYTDVAYFRDWIDKHVIL